MEISLRSQILSHNFIYVVDQKGLLKMNVSIDPWITYVKGTLHVTFLPSLVKKQNCMQTASWWKTETVSCISEEYDSMSKFGHIVKC